MHDLPAAPWALNEALIILTEARLQIESLVLALNESCTNA